jgi:methyl-accepting chemotaxis protein
MEEMTQQNASLMEQAAASSESIVEQVHALDAMVKRYRVGELSAAPAQGPGIKPLAAPRARARG